MISRHDARVVAGMGLVVLAIGLSGCRAVVRGTRDTLWETARISGKVAWEATKLAGKGVKTSVHLATGRTVVPLRKQGNSLFVDVRINRKVTAELLLDTGASLTQISAGLAARLGIDASRGERIPVRLADGRSVEARQVYLKEVRIGRAVVKNVPAVILSQEQAGASHGLLGMTFLNDFIFQIDSQKGQLILNKRMR